MLNHERKPIFISPLKMKQTVQCMSFVSFDFSLHSDKAMAMGEARCF